MAITKTWQVNTMERDLSDGHVNKVIYRVIGKDGDVEKDRATGKVNFVKPSSLPSDFVAYDKLDEATVLNWVKTLIGTDGVTAIEKVIDDNIAILNTPVTATGKPFYFFIMPKPTDQQLQEELAQVVQKHNEAQEIVNQMKTRFTQIQAILDDRKAETVEVVPTAPEETT